MNATTSTRLTADERRDAVVAAALHEFADGGYVGDLDRVDRSGGRRLAAVPVPAVRDEARAVPRGRPTRLRADPVECSTRPPARRRPTTRRCSILDLMGTAYMRLLVRPDLLRVQLQAYAACGDDDVRQVVREEFAEPVRRGQARQRRLERGRSTTSSPRGCCSTWRPRSSWAARPRRGRSAACCKSHAPEAGVGRRRLTTEHPTPLFSPQNLVTTNSQGANRST